VRVLVASLVALVVLPIGAARACPCQSGDPTLTGTSWGSTYAGRLRVGAEVRWYTEGYGVRGVDRADVSDVRIEPSLAWSPTDWLVLSVVAPVAYRSVTHTNLAVEDHVGLADPEIRARFTLLRDRAIAPRNVLGASLGVDIPLMGDVRAQDGSAPSMPAMIRDALSYLRVHFGGAAAPSPAAAEGAPSAAVEPSAAPAGGTGG
jgi:hypothetical protein